MVVSRASPARFRCRLPMVVLCYQRRKLYKAGVTLAFP